MPVEIIKPGAPSLFPLTSPPKEPKPTPEKKILHKIVDCIDRKVWVSVPFPDHITLVADILNEHTITPDQSNKSSKQIYKNLDHEISEALKYIPYGGEGKTTLSSKKLGKYAQFKFSIRYDPKQPLHRAFLTLSRRPGEDFGLWSLKLEFNPSKARVPGLKRIMEQIEDTVAFLNFDALIAAFKIARLDAAIDCIGAHPIDLIAHIPKKGKRLMYSGHDGRPESILLYERKPPLGKPPSQLGVRTTGPLRLMLYERRSYHRQLKLTPPYGDCPVTRVEVTKRWNKGRPHLAALAEISNLFEGRRVAYAAILPVINKARWHSFCQASVGLGPMATAEDWFMKGGLKYAKSYLECEGNLVDPTAWSEWQRGLEVTGFDAWVNAAKKAAPQLS